ncbi:MAG: tyrosine-type recombinase/integrase [Nocardioidaceae bacterium]
MAHVQKRQRVNKDGTPGAVLWCLRYINPETGRERTETFRLKRDAERRLTEIEASKLTGSYVDPKAGQLTVGAWAGHWLDVQVQLKPTTRARYRSILDVHVVPRWGKVELARVRHAEVQKWVAELSSDRSAATVRKIYRVLSQVLGSAVKDGRLARNVAEGVALPRVQSKERRYLTHEQVADLADACAAIPVSKYASTTEADRAAYRLLVLFLAYTGLRWGELAGLRVGRLDLMRRRASIIETYVVVDGHVVPSDPKNHERREVLVPRFLIDQLATHVAGRPTDALVFSGEKAGAPMRSRTFQRAVFDKAAAALGLDGLTPHALRHTAASLAIAAGADVKVVQQMLGHKSATMTLDLYGHLFPDRLDTVADAMDAARTVALETAAGAETGRRRDTAAVVPIRRQ